MASRLTSGISAKPLQHTTVEWLYDNGSGEMSRNPVLNDNMDISNMLNHNGTSSSNTPDTHIHPVYPVLYSFSKILNPHF
jgi:hypothetical protein